MIEKSLKKQIVKMLKYFSLLTIILIGVLILSNFYFLKIKVLKQNQINTLSQVEFQLNNQLSSVEKLATYIKSNYNQNKKDIKDIVAINSDILALFTVDKEDGEVNNIYLQNNKEFSYLKNEIFKTGWSDIFFDKKSDEIYVIYSFNTNEKTYFMVLDMNILFSSFSKLKSKDETSQIRILQKDKVFFLKNNKKTIEKKYLRNKTLQDIITSSPKNKTILMTCPIDDKLEYATYINIPKVDWNIIIRQPFIDIMKSLSTICLISMAIIFLILAIFIYLSRKFSDDIFKSVSILQNAIKNKTLKNKALKTNYQEVDKLMSDIDEMKVQMSQKEESLNISIQSFKSLFNSTMEAIIIHHEGICIDVNDTAIKIFELKSKDEILGKKLLSYVSDKYKNTVISNYPKDTFPYEIALIINKKQITCLVQDKFLKLEDKKYKLTTIIDITELKDKDSLLAQQSKMAAMGEMMENIAHQWRQPLSLISTCASGIKYEKEFLSLSDKKLYESLDMIVENTKYLSNTIDDFRNYFKTKKQKEEFYLESTIFQAIKLLDAVLRNSDINIITNFCTNSKRYGYPNEFLQVLMNILTNAKDALVENQQEERRIIISTYEENSMTVLSVEDNGGGIKSNIIEKVFEPYYTTKKENKGTGIGLYMSHKIITEHMNGTLTVKNKDLKIGEKIYKGCVFTIKLLNEEEIVYSDYII